MSSHVPALRKARSAAKSGPPPLASARVVQEALKEDCSLQTLGDMAAADPALTMRVLAQINSPAFNLSRKVADVRQAISLIGPRGLRNLALSLIVSDLVPNSPDGSILLVQSLRRAAAARLLAESLEMPNHDVCFSTGLLLEIGVLSRAQKDLQGSLKSAHQSCEHRILLETASGAQPHCETGARLVQGIGLPQSTIDAILHHHDPEPPEEPLARLCWAAERIAGAFESGAIVRAKENAIRAATRIGVSTERAMDILRLLPERVEELGAAFQRDLGPQPDLDQLRDDASARLVEMNLQYEQTVSALEAVLKEKEALAEQLRHMNKELEGLASTDGLTGLANRRALMLSLERDLARAQRDKASLGFVLLDVDHFKRFNDQHGHLLGDEVLKAVGAVLAAGARKGDLPARFGGEEFCVILPNADAQGAMLVARRLRIAIERMTVTSPGGVLRVTASFGVATVPSEGPVPTAAVLIERADTALYQAKAAGRNQVIAAA